MNNYRKKLALIVAGGCIYFQSSCSSVSKYEISSDANSKFETNASNKYIPSEKNCTLLRLNKSYSTIDERINEIFRLVSKVKKIKKDDSLIVILGDEQKLLKVYETENGPKFDCYYDISTGEKGFSFGECKSGETPCGLMNVWNMFGENLPVGTHFSGRAPTNNIVEIVDRIKKNKESVVLSRIIQLNGLEEFNKSALSEFIYIHGTNKEYNLGKKASHGCIRMNNSDVVELFASVKNGDFVFIDPGREFLNHLQEQKQ